MKRISIILVVVFATFISTFAQEITGGVDYSGLESKLARSDKKLADEKKANLPKTWLERAEVFEEIADCHAKFLRLESMKNTEAKIYLKEPKEVKSFSDGREEYIYDRITLTFEGGNLKYWEETKPIVPNAADEAVKAYLKTKELDVEGKSTKRITEGFKNLRSIYLKLAISNYNKKAYEKSFDAFKSYVTLGETKEINSVDTSYIYDAALLADSAKKYNEAIIYYNKAAQLNYNNPSIYSGLKSCYYMIGDTAKGIEALNKGVEKYPENQGILVELINHFLSIGESEKALEYLQKAEKKDPTNKTLYFAEGNLYDKMGNTAKAVEVYLKACEMDSTFFNAYFNIGVIYYNKGVKLSEAANNELDNKKFAEKKKIADDEFVKIIPYWEKAYSIIKESPVSDDPETNKSNIDNKKQILENLRSVYYRLNMKDQFEKVEKDLKELKEQ
jgi:tetratricopeptide (TPR) repeat protein